MINLLVSLLTPILGPMGVSDADLLSYVTLCINNMTRLFLTVDIVAGLVCLLIDAAWLKKKKAAK